MKCRRSAHVVKAVAELVDIAVQTNWKYPKNAAVQSQPREFTEDEMTAIQQSDELAEFVRNVAQRFAFSLLNCLAYSELVTKTVTG